MLLCANIHLILLNGATPLSSVVPWLPRSGVSSLSCPENKFPVFCWGRQSFCLPGWGTSPACVHPSYTHRKRKPVCLQQLGLEGLLQWLATCSTHSSPSQSLTTHVSAFHLPKFGDISNLLSCEFSYSLIVSLRGRLHKTDSSPMAWI